jgi:hypothetical protein
MREREEEERGEILNEDGKEIDERDMEVKGKVREGEAWDRK